MQAQNEYRRASVFVTDLGCFRYLARAGCSAATTLYDICPEHCASMPTSAAEDQVMIIADASESI